MNPVNGVGSSSSVNVIEPTQISQQDFVSAVYVERGNMLDAEVRRIVQGIETSNQLLSSVNTLIGKANVSEYGSDPYTATTWTQNGNSVVLDNGYGLSIQPDGNGQSSFTLLDAEGNQLIYQNQTLIPVPSGQTVDVIQNGIPVMNDMTMILDDGTEISFQTGTPGTAYNSADLSGGLADITSITITRDNQGMTITGVDTATPTINAPSLNGETLDTASNDGYVLLESGGLHSWEYDGAKVGSMTQTDPNDPNLEVSGYFARKVAFEAQYANEYAGASPALTQAEIDIITKQLKINYTDASGTGNLTPEEWGALKKHLESAKDNLTSSNQLQTVQLQRALTTYNQNYDAMSNAQSRIYSLLKDVINNVK